LSEVNFLSDRQRNPGEFTPPDTIVLHLYGRYCNANKLAGEVDLFEALDAVKRQYQIDANRIVIRGFSMGGAAAWHFGAHYAGLWAATAPGAGFSETADFLKVFQNEKVQPTWWEKETLASLRRDRLRHQLFQLPAGGLQRRDRPAKAGRRHDGRGSRSGRDHDDPRHRPQTAHRYHPDAKVTINQMIDAIVAKGRDAYPRKVRFTTWTLAYNQMKWVTVDALGKHWSGPGSTRR